MFRKLIFSLLLLMFSLIFMFSIIMLDIYGYQDLVVITVPDDVQSINKAIAMVLDGGTVRVKRGVYVEAIYINKSITLLGEGNPVILMPLLVAYTQNVTIKGLGFIIDPPGVEPAITILNASKLTLENLDIRQTFILLVNSTIVSVRNCSFTGNPGPSISIRGKTSGNIIVEWSQFNQTMALIARQAVGIIFRYNTVNATESSIKLLSECQNATIYLNNFLNGEVEDYGLNNKWYSETLRLGNYWFGISSLKDMDGDGVMDESRRISGTAMSEDKYPLAKPFTEYLKSRNQLINTTKYMMLAIILAVAIITTVILIIRRRLK